MIMFEPCHHRETTSHSQPSIRGCMTIWSTGVGGGPHLTTAHSARQEDMCQDGMYSKTYHTNSCQTSSVYLWVSFFLYSVSNSGRKPTARLFTQTGHQCRRRCQLLQRKTVNRWFPSPHARGIFLGPITCLVETDCVILYINTYFYM